MVMETCLSTAGLAGVIFGCIGATLFAGIGVAILLYYLCRRKKVVPKSVPHLTEQSTYTNDEFVHDVELGPTKTIKIGENQKTQTTPLTKRDRTQQASLSLKPSTNAAFQSTESLNLSARSTSIVNLVERHSSGLGFTVHGGVTQGIFVKNLVVGGSAEKQLNSGDRILSCLIDFQSMALEDAMTILSYASPYVVQLRVERGGGKGENVEEKLGVRHEKTPSKVHPLLRAQSAERMNNQEMKSEPIVVPEPKVEPADQSTNTVFEPVDQSTNTVAEPKIKQHNKKIQSRATKLSEIECQTSPLPERRPCDTQTTLTDVRHHSTEMTPPPEIVSPQVAHKETQECLRVKESEKSTQADEPREPKVETIDRETSLSPYAHLTEDERMQILRLSYEDDAQPSDEPQSSPEPEYKPETPSPDATFPDDEGDSSEKEGSLPDLSQMRNTLTRAKKMVFHESKPLPPSFEEVRIETTSNTTPSSTASPSIADSNSTTRKIVQPFIPRLAREEPAAPGIYRTAKTTLQSTMSETNWLRPAINVKETPRSTSPNITVSAPDAQRAQTILKTTVRDTEREQQEKLLFYQAQLARQQEELAAMGIHIPRASLVENKTEEKSSVILQHRQQF